MKKKFWLPVAAVVTALALTACLKNDDVVRCTPNELSRDRAIIDSFALKNSLDLIWDGTDTGQLYVQIINPGTGSMPSLDSIVAFKLSGKLLNGTEISKAEIKVTDAKYRLRELNNGVLNYGLRKIKEGGSIKLIVPSRLNGLNCTQGQGQNGTIIPANSQIVYDLTLDDVKP